MDLKFATAIFRWPGRSIMRASADLCVEVVQKYGINQFKFDGIGVERQRRDGAPACAISRRCSS